MRAVAWRWPAFVFLGALALVGAGPTGTRFPPPESRTTLAKQLPLAHGGRLTLDNGLGDVTIEAWQRDLVDLRAEQTADTDQDLALVPIDVRSEPDSLAISSRAPAYAPRTRVRVDYRLRVPGDIDLRLVKADLGRVSIADISGRAIVRVLTGTVRVRGFAGYLDASTLNGEIDAALTRFDRGDFVTLETYNGDILLKLPGGAKAHYALRTFNGVIDSNVPLPVLTTYGPNVVHEAGGVEDPLVRLTSVNGSLHVTR
jgi:hypothetical protein